MSAIANFYILKKVRLPGLRKLVVKEELDQIQGLRGDVSPELKKLLLRAKRAPVIVKDADMLKQLKKVFPKSTMPDRLPKNEALKFGMTTRMVTSRSVERMLINNFGGDKMDDDEQTAYEYLTEYGKTPWRYDPSGYLFLDMWRYLKSIHKIHLDTVFVADPWYQITLATRNRYIDRLHPSNFKKAEIRDWVWDHVMLWGHEDDHEEQVEGLTNGLMAAIRIYYKYMKRVDNENIVIWHIG